MANISNFTSLTDQWSNPILIGGSPYALENANVDGNAPWAVKLLNADTLEFSLRPNDLWESGTHRSEISGETMYSPTDTVNISYQMTVQPGAIDPNLDWLVLGQMHADDSSAIVGSLTEDPPIFSFSLRDANGNKGGDYLTIGAYYLPSGSNTPVSVTGTDAALYVSPTAIERGQAYAIQVKASFQDNANGFLQVWVNGKQVVDYRGPLGYGTSTYWKEGIYEGYSPTQPITVDYANTTVTTSADGPTTAPTTPTNPTTPADPTTPTTPADPTTPATPSNPTLSSSQSGFHWWRHHHSTTSAGSSSAASISASNVSDGLNALVGQQSSSASSWTEAASIPSHHHIAVTANASHAWAGRLFSPHQFAGT